MLVEKKHIVNLFRKHFRGKLTKKEGAVFQQLLAENKEYRQILELLTNDELMEEELRNYIKKQITAVCAEIRERAKAGIHAIDIPERPIQ